MTGATILASMSSPRWKSPAHSTGKIHPGTEVPAHSVVRDGTEVEIDGLEGNSTLNLGSDKAEDIGAIEKTPEGNPDSGTEAGNVKISGMNDLLRPLLRMLAGSPTCKLKLSKGIFKQVLEERERNEWMTDSQSASTSGMSLRCAVFKEDIHAGILDGKSIDVSFDNFPYYLRYIICIYFYSLGVIFVICSVINWIFCNMSDFNIDVCMFELQILSA